MRSLFSYDCKTIFKNYLFSKTEYLRFLLIGFIPRKPPIVPSDNNSILLIGSPPDSGLGFSLQAIFDSINTSVSIDRFYLRKFNKPQKIKNNYHHAINIFVGNPIFLLNAIFKLKFSIVYKKYNIGLWFWELENPAKRWRLINHWTDEIWVQSDFVFNIFKKLTPNVYKIPFSLSININKKKTRKYFRLPKKKFIFLFTFDFWSYYERKNPEAVIESFRLAFGSRDDVYLLIKTTHGDVLPYDLDKLNSFITESPNIELRDGFISEEDQYSLINVSDAYVSLHRSEGLGLGMAEAMALGKPVIGTNYSGNLEFMNKINRCLVKYTFVAVPKEKYAYFENQRWADPDCMHAAYFMKKLISDRAFRNKISAQAKKDMKVYTKKNMQDAILKRINNIYG